MDPQTGLSRALLLLLFVYLLPLRGRSHPLGGPSPDLTLKLSGAQGPLQGMPWELQKEQMALEPLQQHRRSSEAWEASQAEAAADLGPHDKVPRDKVPRAFLALQSPTKAPDSLCFGGKIDRIRHHSRLGCNVLKKE